MEQNSLKQALYMIFCWSENLPSRPLLRIPRFDGQYNFGINYVNIQGHLEILIFKTYVRKTYIWDSKRLQIQSCQLTKNYNFSIDHVNIGDCLKYLNFKF
jgi:hypothetical protein